MLQSAVRMLFTLEMAISFVYEFGYIFVLNQGFLTFTIERFVAYAIHVCDTNLCFYQSLH